MSNSQPIHVRRALISAIKGLRVTPREELTLEHGGVRENRRFYLVDERGVMVNGKQIRELSELIAEYRDADRTLTLTLPSGGRISGPVRVGAEIDARFFRMTLRAPVVLGPWSEAISTHVGRSLRLVEADPGRKGVDRGDRGTVRLGDPVSAGSP